MHNVCDLIGTELQQSLNHETYSRYPWRTGCECRARSKFALVVAVFGNARLPTLHRRHLSTVACRSPSQERILHSKLHIPAIIAGHSAALTRLLSQSSSASRQLRDIRRNPPRLVLGKQFCRRSTPWLIELLSVRAITMWPARSEGLSFLLSFARLQGCALT